jgi:hypothetical protein
MTRQEAPISLLRGLLAWCALLLLCTWIYWPGLAGPTVLDDAVNLRVLERLQDNPEFLTDVVSGNRSGPFGRPLSMLSFSLEKVWLDRGVRGAKQVNLVLHMLTATLVLLFCCELFAAMRLGQPRLAALLVAGLWLFSPLLTSTVLYVVQRMAQLAACFALLSLWAYLRWRRSVPDRLIHIQQLWLLLALSACLAAILSKENGLLVIPLLAWLEFSVLHYQAGNPKMSQGLRAAHQVGIAVAGMGLIAVLWMRPDFLLAGYESRDFSLSERLLTQARILWVYIEQLLWVDPALLGIYQDDQTLSRSLMQPATTLAAVLAWLFLGVGAVIALRQRLLTGAVFGLGFFLLAHAMESTVIPLEMYFEHRNYLPSVGVYIALVALGFRLRDRLVWLSRWLLLAWVMLASHSVLVTAVEAELWSSEALLHLAAINRHPNSVRANSEMSRFMAVEGNLQEALAYSARVRELEGIGEFRHQLRDALLECIAGPALSAETISALKADRRDFGDDEATENFYLLAHALVNEQCPETDLALFTEQMARLVDPIDYRAIAPKLYVSLAIVENHIEGYARALEYIERFLRKVPGDKRGLSMGLYFSTALQMEERRAEFLVQLRELERRGDLTVEEVYNLNLLAPNGGGVQLEE